MKVLASLALLLLLVNCYDFNDYIVEFGRLYSTQEEYDFRKKIFQHNYALIQESNSKNGVAMFGVTPWTDKTEEEYDNTLSEPPSFLEAEAEATSLTQPLLGAAELSQSVLWPITPVRNQNTCGSCWAFATVALIESNFRVYNNSELDLSEQSLLECTKSGNSCGGGNLVAPVKRFFNAGLPLETQYPYTSKQGSYNESIICAASGKRLGQNFQWRMGVSLSESVLKSLLMQGPVTVGMYASREFTQYRSDKVWTCGPNATSWFQLNHAVELIGYDEDGNYIIKNSWGRQWGSNGTAKIDRRFPCGIGLYVVQIYAPPTQNSNLRADATKTNLGNVKKSEGRLLPLLLLLPLLFGLLL